MLHIIMKYTLFSNWILHVTHDMHDVSDDMNMIVCTNV